MATSRKKLIAFFLQKMNEMKTSELGFGFGQNMDRVVPSKEFRWIPGNIIFNGGTAGTGHVCIVLNRQISVPPQLVQKLWQTAHLRCTVDGGSNHWRDFLLTHCREKAVLNSMKPPDVITGDFDSITRDTIEFFSMTPKVHTPDQNATDFTKAIGVIQPFLEQRKLKDIVVFHDSSGRFDQVMANINTLFKVQKETMNVFLLSGSSVTWLLRPGKHTIQIPADLVAKQRWCALMPVGQPARNVTTTGLKWNLSGSKLEFGGMVSTSNSYAAEFVQIETDSCLVWSMGAFNFEETVKRLQLSPSN